MKGVLDDTLYLGLDLENEIHKVNIVGDDGVAADGKYNSLRPVPSGLKIHPKQKRSRPFQQQRPAVCVRNAYKSYKPGVPVLENFTMTVKKGTIYSLLGSSGCGKTTLLSCIVGIRNLDGGEVSVFGAKPGTPQSGVPGKKVGYMPQEISLYKDFSISEAVRYFGIIYGMSISKINASRDFLVEFLDLPNASRRIGSLSGGQQRRVSLAMTLVHSPELLILDEPTVGVDPLLRETIWTHLLNLVSSQNTTVIITTHYIEEARQSHVIGLMRHGRLLVETSPADLMHEYGTDQLEDIVLSLCRKENRPAVEGPSRDKPSGSRQLQGDLTSPSLLADEDKSTPSGSKVDSNNVVETLQKIRAVVEKNAFVLFRNKLLLLFMILLPTVHITALCLAMGGDPKPMSVGVVNHELEDPAVCVNQMSGKGGCDVENLSCQVLRKLPPDVIKLRNYASKEEAVKGVTDGDIWGYILFPVGYSNHVYTRAVSGNIIDNATLQGSVLHIRLDQSNNQIGLIMKRIIYDAYKDFVKELLVNCGFKPEFGESPIIFRDSIYGSDDPSFRQFIATGVLTWIFSFYTLCSTSISFIWDKKQGTMERARVAGVGTFEVMTAFMVSEGVVLIIQMAICLFLMIPVFGVQLHGSLYLALALCFLSGVSGISSGLLLGTVCSEEMEAVLIALATFCPNFLITGIFWPIEGLPDTLRWFSTYFMPTTLSSEASRSIFSRGWGLSHPNVWPGFLSTLIWISLYWTITFTIHRTKGKR